MKTHLPLVLSAGIALLADSGIAQQTLDWEFASTKDRTGAIRMWIPDIDGPVQQIITLAPGLDGDGRGQVNNPQWQELARKTDSALAGLSLKGYGYYGAEEWGFDALDDALKAFAKEADRPELTRAPLLMWGHSAGGQFNYCYAATNPGRVMAFIVNKGVSYPVTARGRTMRIPAVFFIGENDNAARRDAIMEIYEPGRRRKSPWTVVIEPGVGHGAGGSREYAMRFFEAVINEDMDDPWRGNLETGTIEEADSFSRPDKQDTWLPNEELAQAWRTLSGHGNPPDGETSPNQE